MTFGLYFESIVVIVLVVFFLIFEFNTFEGFPSIAREGSRQHMDIVEERLKRFIQHMGIMILELLGTLNRHQIVQATSQTANVLLWVPVHSVPEVISRTLYFKTHVAADTPALLV